jgi:hypothetical protein
MGSTVICVEAGLNSRVWGFTTLLMGTFENYLPLKRLQKKQKANTPLFSFFEKVKLGGSLACKDFYVNF